MFAARIRSALPAARPLAQTSRVGALQRTTPAFARTIITKRYTKDHEWVSYDSETKIGTVSITDHAQQSLGDVVFVELPSAGSEIKQGDQIGAVESVKAASDIYAPISGIIEEINETLGDQPNLLNKSPEDEGWLCKIQVTNPAELDDLLNEEAYTKLCEDGEDH
ncbi:hypothetical protein BOTBODRAFT_177226 [Botryobasidium botryosum FD-172 SS1]|uniref:Glycine cleavage system H protein n=1 Tax=Botryobasidium botryosum (strain FD-172 SS1) TaxID=930990 RepID=A0A067M7R9_BOTB1|nr:hypothetical protein BOTBODRAFT_177226 [Botryobasidium botryosum FD-172 SS1]